MTPMIKWGERMMMMMASLNIMMLQTDTAIPAGRSTRGDVMAATDATNMLCQPPV